MSNKKLLSLNFSEFETEGYTTTESLDRAIYILPTGELWSGYYKEAPEVRGVEHREIEAFIDEEIDRYSAEFWPSVLSEVIMVIPEKETLLMSSNNFYTEAQIEQVNNYRDINWEITTEDPKLPPVTPSYTLEDYLEKKQIKPYSSKETQNMIYNPRNTPTYLESLTKTLDKLENYPNNSEHIEGWGINDDETGIFKDEFGQIEGLGTQLLTFEKDAIEAYNLIHGYSKDEIASPTLQQNLNVEPEELEL